MIRVRILAYQIILPRAISAAACLPSASMISSTLRAHTILPASSHCLVAVKVQAFFSASMM